MLGASVPYTECVAPKRDCSSNGVNSSSKVKAVSRRTGSNNAGKEEWKDISPRRRTTTTTTKKKKNSAAHITTEAHRTTHTSRQQGTKNCGSTCLRADRCLVRTTILPYTSKSSAKKSDQCNHVQASVPRWGQEKYRSAHFLGPSRPRSGQRDLCAPRRTAPHRTAPP